MDSESYLNSKQYNPSMKSNLLACLMGCAITLMFAFTMSNTNPAASSAQVVSIEGLYIFTDSKPLMPYDSLGTVDLGFVWDTQYESVRNNLIKRAKREHMQADGLILKLDKKGVDKCTVIRFK